MHSLTLCATAFISLCLQALSPQEGAALAALPDMGVLCAAGAQELLFNSIRNEYGDGEEEDEKTALFQDIPRLLYGVMAFGGCGPPGHVVRAHVS